MNLLLIFVKHPIPGQVKTRLAKTVGNNRALAIYQKLLEYTLEQAEGTKAAKAIFYGNEVPSGDLWDEAGYQRFLQVEGDLGTRMQHAFAWGFEQGYSRIQVIGSDCPGVTSELLQEGFEALATHDLVLGPAQDGGYYLLGMNSPFYGIFEKKSWSTDRLFGESVISIFQGKKSFCLLPELSDIDHEGDLEGTFLEKMIEYRKNE